MFPWHCRVWILHSSPEVLDSVGFSVLVVCSILMRARKYRTSGESGERGVERNAYEHPCMFARMRSVLRKRGLKARARSKQASKYNIYVFLRFSWGRLRRLIRRSSPCGGAAGGGQSLFSRFSFRALLLCCSGATSGGRLPAVEGEGFFSCSFAESGSLPFPNPGGTNHLVSAKPPGAPLATRGDP